jgi:Zn-dependent protease
MNLTMALFLLPGLIIGLTVHEFAHAWSASLLGDNFPRRQGRVSLNPFRHLSLLGTLAIFLLPVGWGKPVIVNLYNFKHPKRDYLITSLAGPLANVVVVAVGIGMMHLTSHPYRFSPSAQHWINGAYYIICSIVFINIMLAVLNLIPIPPLDGSKIWPCLIPGAKPTMSGKTTWIFLIIIILLMSSHSLDGVIDFAIKKVEVLLPKSDKQTFALLQSQGMAASDDYKYADAQRYFTQALAINPRSDTCYYWRAYAKGQQLNYTGALEDMNQAIEIFGNYPPYLECRAKMLTALGREGDAQADLNLAAALRGPSAASEPASQPTSCPASEPASAMPTVD